MSEPTSMEEYNRRFTENHKIEGYGIAGVRTHMPCPFCAAPDFIIHGILDVEEAMSNGATCRECGRSSRTIFKHTRDGITFEMVQTGGPGQPEWFEPKMRVVGDGEGYYGLGKA